MIEAGLPERKAGRLPNPKQMKEIKAIIQPFMLDPVLDALNRIPGLPAATISEARAISPERGQYAQIHKVKLEIMVPDPQVETVLRAIQQSAHTGNPGDGRIFVIPVENTVNIRTGEYGAGDPATATPAEPPPASTVESGCKATSNSMQPEREQK